MKTPSF